MKHIILILLILVFGNITAQTSQQIIPEYELIGKSADELRLMRNEIFARHGYIFKSEDLNKYFSSKRWYKPALNNVDSTLTEIEKINIKLISKFESTPSNDNYETIYSDIAKASYTVIKDKTDGQLITKSSEISFRDNYNYGIIKTVIEKTFFGGEFVPTVIFAETIDPSKPYWQTTKYFNDIQFFTKYYRVVKYGCCGSENYYEFYNYESEKPFLKSNEEYFTIEIPNSKIDLFIGYNHEVGNKEKNIIANLNLATINGEINSILFKANNEKDFEDMLPYFTPKIEIITNSSEDQFRDKNKIELWSMNFEKQLDAISGFAVRITFIGDSSGKKIITDIPIINGCLNGIPENQTIIIELK